MGLRSFSCGVVVGMLIKDDFVKCLKFLILVVRNLSHADKIFGSVARLIPEMIGIIFVLGLVLVFYISLFVLDWLPKISSPKKLKLLRITLIVENLYLMIWVCYKVICYTLDHIIFGIAIQYWIAFIVLFTSILTSYYVWVVVMEERYRLAVTQSHPIVHLFVVMSLVLAHVLLAHFRGYYWALAYFPPFLGLIYISFMFPTGIFVATAWLCYLIICYSTLPHETLIQLKLKNEHALLTKKILAVSYHFVFEVVLIGFGWLCMIWYWFEGSLVLWLGDMLALLFYIDA